MKALKLFLYPFAFALSWMHWLFGHISWLLMELIDSPWWFIPWFRSYQTNMEISSDFQDFVEGKGSMWPWGEEVKAEDFDF